METQVFKLPKSLKKDAKYYINENYEINPLFVKILELYKEFLTLNCGFARFRWQMDREIKIYCNYTENRKGMLGRLYFAVPVGLYFNNSCFIIGCRNGVSLSFYSKTLKFSYWTNSYTAKMQKNYFGSCHQPLQG